MIEYDVSDAPEIEPEPDMPVKPEPIDHWKVKGAADLPDDVKNGEIVPGEDDPSIADEPPTQENRP